MIKNTAGQKIGAQLINASNGAAFSGVVTIDITIDAGTQAPGTVGGGVCTLEGNGYYTYAPSQAETNGNLIAYTFHGTGAITVTVQVFTVGFDYYQAQVPSNLMQIRDDPQSATDLQDFADEGYDPVTNKVQGVVLVDTVTTVTTPPGPTAIQIADAILARNIDGGSSGGRTVTQALSALRNRTAIVAFVLTVYEQDGLTPLWEANVATAPGDPLISVAPTT